MSHKPVKNERLFAFFASLELGPMPPTDAGRAQFVAHQSEGIEPEAPDPYFVWLSRGKWQFDWLTRELQKGFEDSMESELRFIEEQKKNPAYTQLPHTGWPGLYVLWLDWEGDRWVLPHLLKWWRHGLPPWIGQECADPLFREDGSVIQSSIDSMLQGYRDNIPDWPF